MDNLWMALYANQLRNREFFPDLKTRIFYGMSFSTMNIGLFSFNFELEERWDVTVVIQRLTKQSTIYEYFELVYAAAHAASDMTHEDLVMALLESDDTDISADDAKCLWKSTGGMGIWDSGIKSLSVVVNLVHGVEVLLDIDIPDPELAKVVTFDDFLSTVNRLKLMKSIAA